MNELDAARAAYIKARDDYHAAQDECHCAGLYDRELFDAKVTAFTRFSAARIAYFDACYDAGGRLKTCDSATTPALPPPLPR